MKDNTHEDPKILAAAEKQMQAWAFGQELADQTSKMDKAKRLEGQLGYYITLSREAGVGIEAIAQAVGRKLGWEVLDKNLVDQVAERYELDREMLDLVDETSSSWLFNVLGSWLDPKIIPHEKYVVRLTRIVLAAARRGNVIFVGRGATFLLPREHGLAVRIIASEKSRIKYIMQHEKLDDEKAKEALDNLDRGRTEFVQKFFQRNASKPHNYDLVLNVDRLGPEGVAEQIVHAYHHLYPAET